MRCWPTRMAMATFVVFFLAAFRMGGKDAATAELRPAIGGGLRPSKSAVHVETIGTRQAR